MWLCGFDGDTIHEWCNANPVVPTSLLHDDTNDNDNDDDNDYDVYDCY